MGIDIAVPADIDVGGPFRRRARQSRVLGDFARALPELVDDPLLRQFLDMDRPRDHSLVVSFHPLGWVGFAYEGKTLVCSARTNPVGPGYHAYLVELLDRLAVRLGFTWMWGEGEKCTDETGYAATRDFGALQAAMHDWLRLLARSLFHSQPEKSDGCVAVCLSTHLASMVQGPADEFAATPLGFRDRTWFDELARSGGPGRECEEFFPWYGRELDARMWLGTGLAMAWCELPWHAPSRPEERRAYELTLSCFQRAAHLDPNAPLPHDDLGLIRRLAESRPDDGLAPPPEGIGYRRRPVRHALPERWSLSAPGYFYYGIDDDGATLLLSHGRRSIRIGLAARPEGRAYDSLVQKLAAGALSELHAVREEEFSVDSVEGKAWLGVGDEGYVLFGFATSGHSACLATIVDGIDNTPDWPEETWRSLRRAPVDTGSH